ncbi:MAG: hypothetical protein JJU11_00530 [Candidatus Sumerlaeia bacterium]|nr:hypothetical protein [Candidatus Sumerlaeia bacterium]
MPFSLQQNNTYLNALRSVRDWQWVTLAILMALALCVIHGSLVRHAAELRMYGWMALGGAVILWAAMRHWERPSFTWVTVLAVAHLFLLNIHVGSPKWTIVFFLAVLVAGVIGSRDRRWMIGVLLAFLLPIFLTLPIYLHIARSVSHIEVEQLPSTMTLPLLHQTLHEITIGQGKFSDRWEMIVGSIAFLLSLGIVAWRGWKPRSDRRVPWVVVLLAAAWGAPILAWIFSATTGMRGFGEPRYYITGTAAVIVAFSAGIALFPIGIQNRKWMLIPVGAFFYYVSVADMGARTSTLYSRDGIGMNTVMGILQKEAEPGTPLVVTHGGPVTTLALFYLKDNERFPVTEVGRHLPDELRREITFGAIRKDKDVLLLKYKTLDNFVETLITEEFGPWSSSEIVDGRRSQPHVIWFRR